MKTTIARKKIQKEKIEKNLRLSKDDCAPQIRSDFLCKLDAKLGESQKAIKKLQKEVKALRKAGSRSKAYIQSLELLNKHLLEKEKINQKKNALVGQGLFTPQYRPEVAIRTIGFFSAKSVVEKAEELGMFDDPQKVIRIHHRGNARKKNQTTVLFSTFGIAVLMEYINERIDLLAKISPPMSKEEEQEILNWPK